MATKKNQYTPQTVSHPGKTLSSKLEELGMGAKEFAVRTGKPEKTISEVIAGESSITPDMAVLFEDVLNIPAHFWLARQNNYNEAVSRLKREAALNKAIEWSKQFPYLEMAKLGWVTTTNVVSERVEALYKFFRVGSDDAYNDYYFNQKLKVSFRLTLANQKKPHVIAAWLRQGEIQAEKLVTGTYNKDMFLKKLVDIKAIMALHPVDFFKQLQDICLEAGVKVVYTPSLKGGSIHGSTRWLNDTPLIQMSAKYQQNDIFWFTFFHEVGHILLHGKKYIALENVNYNEEDKEKEKEADAFAIKWVFSESEEAEVLRSRPLEEEDILMFANKFNTHPAMIIGRFHFKRLIHFSVGRQFIQKIEIINQ